MVRWSWVKTNSWCVCTSVPVYVRSHLSCNFFQMAAQQRVVGILQDALGRSALMFAAGNCAEAALLALLAAGATLGLRDRRSRSVLDYAPDDSKVKRLLHDRCFQISWLGWCRHCSISCTQTTLWYSMQMSLLPSSPADCGQPFLRIHLVLLRQSSGYTSYCCWVT